MDYRTGVMMWSAAEDVATLFNVNKDTTGLSLLQNETSYPGPFVRHPNTAMFFEPLRPCPIIDVPSGIYLNFCATARGSTDELSKSPSDGARLSRAVPPGRTVQHCTAQYPGTQPCRLSMRHADTGSTTLM